MIATSTAAPRTLPITLPPQREKEPGTVPQLAAARQGAFADRLDRAAGQKQPADARPKPLNDDPTTRERLRVEAQRRNDAAQRTPPGRSPRVDEPRSNPGAPLPASATASSGAKPTADPVDDPAGEETVVDPARQASDEPWWAALLPQAPPTAPAVALAPALRDGGDPSASATGVVPQDLAAAGALDLGDAATSDVARARQLGAETAASAKLALAGGDAALQTQPHRGRGDTDPQVRDAIRQQPGGAMPADGDVRESGLHAAATVAALASRGETDDTRSLRSEDPVPTALATVPGPVAGPAAPAVAVPTRLAAHPGSADFATQLGGALSAFVRQGVHHARLELNPAEMGPLTVQIQLDGDRAQVHLAAEHAQTRQALEQSMPHLAGSLREAGLTLTGGGVSDRAPRQPPLPSDWEDEDGQRARRDRLTGLDADITIDAAGSAQPVPLVPTGGRRGVVDLVA